MIRVRKATAFLLAGIMTFQMSFTFTGTAQATGFPSDVENLSATFDAGDIVLSWDVAYPADRDNGYIAGYKVYYGEKTVRTENDFYDFDINTLSTDTTFRINDLKSGQKYFFAVTALDDQGNESELFSNEASAFFGDSTDVVSRTAPTDFSEQVYYAEPDVSTPLLIKSARHAARGQIEVEFSAPVVVNDSTAFFMESQADGLFIEFAGIMVDGAKVRLDFEPGTLIEGNYYSVIGSSRITDTMGNPLSSGVTDTAEFQAKTFAEVKILEEEVSPVVEVPALPSSPKNTPDPLQNLTEDLSMLGMGKVMLEWKALTNTENLRDIIVYSQKNNAAWDQGYSVGTDRTTVLLDVDPQAQYLFKAVVISQDGIPSTPVFSTVIDTGLSETGATTSGLMLLGLIGAVVFFVRRRVLA